jgi:hypothetical protein
MDSYRIPTEHCNCQRKEQKKEIPLGQTVYQCCGKKDAAYKGIM